MSDNAKCRVCVQIGVKLPMLPPPHICTGRPGCVRAISARDAAAGYRSGDTINGPAPVRAAGMDGVPEGLDIVRRLRSIARAITYCSQAAEDRHEWEAADEITRLRAENARLTKERDEARALPAKLYDAAWLEMVNGNVTRKTYDTALRMLNTMAELIPGFRPIMTPSEQQARAKYRADRHARDVAMVKAGIEAAAKLHDDHADRLAESARRYRANTGEPDGPRIHAAEDHRENAKAIRAIDPKAVLKGMEDGRDGI